MQYRESDVDAGLQAGLDRFSADYPAVFLPPIEATVRRDGRALFRDVVATWPDPCEPRFVRLAAEFLALGVSVRTHQSEPNLTPDDLRCAIGFLSWFLNSFKHR